MTSWTTYSGMAVLISPASSMKRVLLIFARLPGQVERIDRDAMPAQPRPGIEGLEAEGLGLRRVDDFPDVDAHPVETDLEFVDQRDVDAAEDVLEQLRRLGRAAEETGTTVCDRLVERHGRLQAGRRVAADDLGNLRTLLSGLPGSSRSGENAR